MYARRLAAFLLVMAMPPIAQAGAAPLIAQVGGPPPGLLHLAQATPPTEYGYSLPSLPMAGLPPARQCTAQLPVFGNPDHEYTAPAGTIAMSNDGGWCWIEFGQVFRARPFVPLATVIDPPANGRVTLERMKDRIGVAYRPAPGFTGTDRFVVRTDGPLPHAIPFAVLVR